MFDDALQARARALVALYREAGLSIVTAESCTGGLVAGLITEVPGSSAVLERGFVTYSNAAKAQSLGVPTDLLREFGAVSTQTAQAMAAGALTNSMAKVAVGITGVAGPDGGTPDKPVGLVQFACQRRGFAVVAREMRFGPLTRAEIRHASINTALDLLTEAAQLRP
jgi:nicotinamide-nucleotide amidase